VESKFGGAELLTHSGGENDLRRQKENCKREPAGPDDRTDEGSNKAGSTHGNEFDVGEMIDDAIEELFNDS